MYRYVKNIHFAFFSCRTSRQKISGFTVNTEYCKKPATSQEQHEKDVILREKILYSIFLGPQLIYFVYKLMD